MPVSMTEKLEAWLATYPYWDHYPVNLTIFPGEVEETSQETDLQGNTMVNYRCYVTLRWETPGQWTEVDNNYRLWELRSWVRQQNVMMEAPCFGDVSYMGRILPEKGGFTPGAQFVTYTLTLTVDFSKVYQVEK